MTQYKINRAYTALTQLINLKLPPKKALGIYKLAKCLEGYYEFALSEERKYINDFNGVICPDGTVSFKDPQEFASCQEKIAELNEMTVDVEFTPVVLQESDLGDQNISPVDIYNLEGLVSFE